MDSRHRHDAAKNPLKNNSYASTTRWTDPIATEMGHQGRIILNAARWLRLKIAGFSEL